MLCGVANKWRQLGTQFELQRNELEAIRMNYPAPVDGLLEVIAMKKARTSHFWWTDIVEALRAIKENSLADRICRKYNIVQSQFHSGSYCQLNGIGTQVFLVFMWSVIAHAWQHMLSAETCACNNKPRKQEGLGSKANLKGLSFVSAHR